MVRGRDCQFFYSSEGIFSTDVEKINSEVIKYFLRRWHREWSAARPAQDQLGSLWAALMCHAAPYKARCLISLLCGPAITTAHVIQTFTCWEPTTIYCGGGLDQERESLIDPSAVRLQLLRRNSPQRTNLPQPRAK